MSEEKLHPGWRFTAAPRKVDFKRINRECLAAGIMRYKVLLRHSGHFSHNHLVLGPAGGVYSDDLVNEITRLHFQKGCLFEQQHAAKHFKYRAVSRVVLEVIPLAMKMQPVVEPKSDSLLKNLKFTADLQVTYPDASES